MSWSEAQLKSRHQCQNYKLTIAIIVIIINLKLLLNYPRPRYIDGIKLN